MQSPEPQGAGASDPSKPFPHGISPERQEPKSDSGCRARAATERALNPNPAPPGLSSVSAASHLHKQLKVFGKVLLPGTGRSVLPLPPHASSPKTSTTAAVVAAMWSHLPAPPWPRGEGVSWHAAGQRGKQDPPQQSDITTRHGLSCLPLRHCAVLVLLQTQASHMDSCPSLCIRQHTTHVLFGKSTSKTRELHSKTCCISCPSSMVHLVREQSGVEVQDYVTHTPLSAWTPRG